MLLNQASGQKDDEQIITYKNALTAIKNLLALSSNLDVFFWGEQADAINVILRSKRLPSVPVSIDQSAIKKLTILSKPRANYTEAARITQTSGTVRVRVTFSADQQIKNVLVLHSLPFGLTQAAVKAAKQIKFEPAIHNGALVSIVKVLEYNFNLY